MNVKLSAAMILCAGFGTRMRDFTDKTPKSMLPVGDKPLLEHTVGHLSRLGITDIIINLHYLPEKITSYFGDGSRYGVRILYSHEEKPLGTAGAVKKAQNLLSVYDDFLVLYGDIICTHNYMQLYQFHKSRPSAASIIVHERLKSNSIVEMDETNKVVRFIERPEKEVIDKRQNWVNSGLYCINKTVLNYIAENEFCDFPADVFPRLVKHGSLYAYPLEGYRCAIDSSQRYETVCKDYSNGEF